MTNNPKISVIMPVRNMAEYLEESIGSWRSQTMKEIEIICVDDASTDNSYEMLLAMAGEDERIVVHRFEENGTAWMARKWGVANAKGEYILFADADDTMVPTACEELYAEMKQNPVDILHFDANIINANNLPQSRVDYMARFVKPYKGSITGEKVFKDCFENKKYNFSLWNKLFSAQLCKDAFAGTKDMLLPKAQDKMAYWVIALNAESYRGIPDKKYYNYFFGRGSTGQNNVTLKQFENYCKMGLTADAVEEYMKDRGLSEKYSRDIKENRKQLFNDCFSRFEREVSEDMRRAAFDLLIQYWGVTDVVSKMAEKYWFDRYKVANWLKDAESLKFDGREIKTIGTYYHSAANGGAQRVMCELALLWDSMGYNVVIFTSEEPSEDDYQLPENAVRIVLPNHAKINGKTYRQRAEVLSAAIRKYKIDVFVNHAWVMNMMLWDELVCKAEGAAYIAHCHNVFSIPVLRSFRNVQSYIGPYLISDAVVTLSATDKKFWQHWNKNVHNTINPFTEGIDEWKVTENLDKKQIVWVGRISGEKRPEDALEIMRQVVQDVPDAHLNIIGSTSNDSYMAKFTKKVSDMGLENNVTLHGFQSDVKPYYALGSVFLMTSEYEGYPLTLQESKLAGLPVVMYELPYLTLTEGKRGMITVKQGDVKSAAQAIVKLLKDDEMRHSFSRQARAHVEQLFSFDFAGLWNTVFESINQQHTDTMDEYDHIFIETLYAHIDKGMVFAANGGLHRKELEDIKNSLSFRIGRAITLVPRLARKFIRKCKEKGIKRTIELVLEKVKNKIG